jgi:Domain of unknown function (DUF4286)
MLIYNVTVSVDLDTHEDWLAWMRATHIPDVMSTGMFLSYRLTKMLDHEHDDIEIYAIQYLCKDMAHLQAYQADHAEPLQAAHRNRYEGKYTVFRSLLEIIDHNEHI